MKFPMKMANLVIPRNQARLTSMMSLLIVMMEQEAIIKMKMMMKRKEKKKKRKWEEKMLTKKRRKTMRTKLQMKILQQILWTSVTLLFKNYSLKKTLE